MIVKIIDICCNMYGILTDSIDIFDKPPTATNFEVDVDVNAVPPLTLTELQ